MNKKGSLLFETFVAVMVLSIGVTAVLGVFGEALFAGSRQMERKAAKDNLNQLLFGWFADPRSPVIAEGGNITVPLDAGESGRELLCAVESQKLAPPAPDSADPSGNVPIQKESQFYQVKFRVANEQDRSVMDLESVIYLTKKAAS